MVYPVIPKGHIIYRLIPSAIHTDEDIETTLKAFEATKKKLDAGEYKVESIPDMADGPGCIGKGGISRSNAENVLCLGK